MIRLLAIHRPVTKILKSSLTFSLSMAVGDVICQTAFPHPTQQPSESLSVQSSSGHPSASSQRAVGATTKTSPEFDSDRTLRMFLTGFLSSGPLSLAWNHLIDGTLGQARTLPKLLTKVVVHSAFFTPIMISSSLISITLLSGHSLSDARLKVENDLPHALQMAYMYWPLQSLIMFRFFANPQSRIVYQSLASGVWNIFLSYLANLPQKAGEMKLRYSNEYSRNIQTPNNNKVKKLRGTELGSELRSLFRMEKEKLVGTKAKSIRFLRETVIAATILPILHSISYWTKLIGCSIEEGLVKGFLSGQPLEEYFIKSESF